jgi:hypothetical protein
MGNPWVSQLTAIDLVCGNTDPAKRLRWQWHYKKRMVDGTLAPNFGILSQTIEGLVPNAWYSLSFAAYNDNSDSDNDYFLRVNINGEQINDGNSIALSNLVITQTIRFQAPASAQSGTTLSFESQNNAGSNFVSESV